nr:winged helix-turn-helix domain-containing protein [Thermococcus sp.]
MDYETIDIHDGKAKELAQILVNDKAIAILHLLEDRALSISEISKELNLPISTVSYHIERMLNVGLVEIAGKKYGKRLQEVKLYRASNRPILLLPRKKAAVVKKKTLAGIDRLHIISLGLAGLVAAGVYGIARILVTPAGEPSRGTNYTVMSAPERALAPKATNTSTGVILQPPGGELTHSAALIIGLVVAAFFLTSLLVFHVLKRRP